MSISEDMGAIDDRKTLTGACTESRRNMERPMLRRGVSAGAFLAVALAAYYTTFSLHGGVSYVEPGPVPKSGLVGGPNEQNDTGSCNGPKAALDNDIVKEWSWTPSYDRMILDLPRILFWTRGNSAPSFARTGWGPHNVNKDCPYRCYISDEESKINISDAVVFYAHDLDAKHMPKHRFPFQKWVFWSYEPPWDTPVQTLKDMKEIFNWTFTYRLDSHILGANGNVTLVKPGIPRYPNDTLKRIWQGKTKIVSWTPRECKTVGKREDYVRELQKYIHVDAYDTCGKKRCPSMNEADCYRFFAANYYFFLSFENCICKDYVTEILFKVLQYDIVPVVLGGADYTRAAPPGSFIDALSFKSPKDLAKYLEKVANSFDLYSRYFAWKNKYNVTFRSSYTYCELCRKLYSDSYKETSVVPDLLQWWNTSSRCRTWNRVTRTLQ